MNGLDIVRHGVDMLLRNLGPALRVSLGPVLIAAVATAILAALGLGGTGFDAEAGQVTGGVGVFFGALISGLVWLFTLSWVAVAWHRYVLLEERTGLLPPLRQDLVWPYLGRTILLTVLLVLAALPMSLVLGLVAGASQSLFATGFIALVLWLALGWLGMRLSLVLPARAVDRPMGFGASWTATAPASGAIFLVVLVLGIINVVLGALFGLIGGNFLGSVPLIVQWFTAMLGLSVLTTLYGTLVEHRALAV